MYWSPRIGFNWDPAGDNKNQFRGTVGVFTGPTPGILIGNAYANTGLGLVTLNCSGALNAGLRHRHHAAPEVVQGSGGAGRRAGGYGGRQRQRPELQEPAELHDSLGFDRQLPNDFIFTFEGLYRKAINGILVRDLNLKGPTARGRSAVSRSQRSHPLRRYHHRNRRRHERQSARRSQRSARRR